jgi:nucleoside phosphorylase
MTDRRPARHRTATTSTTESSSQSFEPQIPGLPDLPPIDWSAIGAAPPELLSTPENWLPQADAVVITWASAEWAAMEHVFVQSDQAMPYADRFEHWSDWQEYTRDLPYYPGWTEWGSYRLVGIGGRQILLFKSNTHLDWPGQSYLTELAQRICQYVEPKLLMSIGTAGGARLSDPLGTVNAVNAGTLYQAGQPQSQWPTWSNPFRPPWQVLDQPGFSKLLFPIPATSADLALLTQQFNSFYDTSYSLTELDALGLDLPTSLPAVNDLTGAGTPLLTTSTFVVANTSGNLASFACVEMDDAILAQVASAQGVPFAFVRNVSDPVQNAALPETVQGNWGSAVYDVYGFYTSYNGALAAWAILAGGA